jgi:hypothetical protein
VPLCGCNQVAIGSCWDCGKPLCHDCAGLCGCYRPVCEGCLRLCDNCQARFCRWCGPRDGRCPVCGAVDSLLAVAEV